MRYGHAALRLLKIESVAGMSYRSEIFVVSNYCLSLRISAVIADAFASRVSNAVTAFSWASLEPLALAHRATSSLLSKDRSKIDCLLTWNAEY
jgi:hypothetical protein